MLPLSYLCRFVGPVLSIPPGPGFAGPSEFGHRETYVLRNARAELLVDLFEGAFITLNCPRCGYGMDVELLSVRLQKLVFCPCCKISIQLMDADASAHATHEEVEAAMENIERELKKLETTFRFEI